MTESRKLRPRGEFGPAGRQLLRKLDGAYSFDDAPELEILAAQAAKTADMVDRLQRLVDEADSLRTTGSSGRNVVPIPELVELRHYRQQLQRLIAALRLPDADDDGMGRVPSRSEQARNAANARWSRRHA